MKKLALFALLLSLNAIAADKTLLSCSTAGDALGSIDLVESNGKAIAKIKYSEADEEEDPTVTYKLTSNLKNIGAGDSDTLVGEIEGTSYMFGGAITDAIMIRVLPGQKKAYLAAKNNVYYLHCYKN